MKKNQYYSDATSPKFDVIVVGSGPAGVNATYPLIMAGLKVAIIDAGLDSKKQEKQSEDISFVQQYVSPAYDLLRRSSYVFNRTYQLLQIQSDLEIIQSLAKGGLSEIWHGICDYYSQDELKAIGLPPLEVQKEYREITDRIKNKIKTQLDLHSRLVLESAEKRFDLPMSVYRALVISYKSSLGIEDLLKYKNFTYIPNQLVSTVVDKKTHTEVRSFEIETSRPRTTSGRFVILAAGSINTTRILLHSLQLFDYRTTFLTKAHFLTACLHIKTLIRRDNYNRLNLGQVVMSSKETDKELDKFFIQLYHYNPKSLHKALRYIPLPKYIALPLLSTFVHSLVVADVRFPVFESKKKFCTLKKYDNDKNILGISFQESKKELNHHKKEFENIKYQLKSLGLFPIKAVSGYATAHYAGGVPFRQMADRLSVDINGRLHQARRIYIADSSTWRVLPAKPPTLTIMANASRVAKKVIRNFR